MSRLTAEQIARHAADAGFEGRALTTAVAIALAESSGGDPRAHNDTPPDNSYGLWQINLYGALAARRQQYGLDSNEDLYTPAVNARIAYSLYTQRGRSFEDWATYTEPPYPYRRHLERARRAVSRRGRQGGEGGGPDRQDEGRSRGDRRIVLDLTELKRLAGLFHDSARRVEHTRREVQKLASEVETARAKLPDKALAGLIDSMFAALAAPTQLARAAERLDRQGDYAEKVRRLTEQADGGDDTWNKADARRFVHRAGRDDDPFERAVKEALLGGTIIRSSHGTDKAGSKGGNPKVPALSGLTNGKVPSSRLSPVGEGERLLEPAAVQFRKLDAAARAVGIDLQVESGYRTYVEQAYLYDLYRSGRGNLAAPPGRSDHGWGLSVDVRDSSNPKVFNWLRQRAAEYGFVNDVPSEKWHWTYKPR